MTKNERIKAKRLATKKRRKKQSVSVAKLKLVVKSKRQRKALDRAFLEAKWFYNHCLANDFMNDKLLWKDVSFQIKVGDHFEERNIEILSSQMRQGIIKRLKQSVYSLSKKKENGEKVGKLKFKHEVNCIDLPQYGITYKFLSKNKIRIQKLGKFRVLGSHQIPENAEIASAQLIKRASGYYLHIIYYLNKEDNKQYVSNVVGVDFGIKNQLTLSNGLKVSYSIEETSRLKKLQALKEKVSSKKKKRKIKLLIKKEHERIVNIRKDIQNKIISLLKRFRVICFQDENIKEWHEGWFGRKIQHTGIGGITSRLKSLETPMVRMLDSYQPTTKTCSHCGYRNDVSLKDRTFKCSNCGLVIDRDINASINMVKMNGYELDNVDISTLKEVVNRLFSQLRKYVALDWGEGTNVPMPIG